MFPSKDTFIQLSRRGNLIPVYQELYTDLETPVSALLKIDEGRYAFLLESVTGGETIARYSFLGVDPALVISSVGRTITLQKKNSRGGMHTRSYEIDDDPLAELKRLMSGERFVPVEGLPRFSGGFVGYLSYDMVRFFERLPEKNTDERDVPEMLFLRTDTVLLFDHVAHKIKVVSTVSIPDEVRRDAVRLGKLYDRAQRRISGMIRRLQQPLDRKKRTTPAKKHRYQPGISQPDFEAMVRTAKQYIRRGDIIQTVLSQRLQTDLTVPPFDVYRALRMVNPSPYMFYIKTPEITLVGSSPEVMVRCEGTQATVRPIAGTRPRGNGPAEDEKLAQELLRDPKEKAEHIMLVDLGRNDLGRVCRSGSIAVTELMTIERYSHVMHIVSNVTGTLSEGKDAFDVIRATFPAGTVSGAPKIRAMEIIEELEPVRRGPYAGCIGYFSFSGNLDSCITIRTIVIKNKTAYVQAGAGIVADSVPAREYQETLNKAKALLRALELAEQQTV